MSVDLEVGQLQSHLDEAVRADPHLLHSSLAKHVVIQHIEIKVDGALLCRCQGSLDARHSLRGGREGGREGGKWSDFDWTVHACQLSCTSGGISH